MVHFTAPWCEPCQQIRERLYPRVDIAERLGAVHHVEVDFDTTAASRGVCTRLRITTLPTLGFFDPDGAEYGDLRIVGAEPAYASLRANLDEVLTRNGIELAAA